MRVTVLGAGYMGSAMAKVAAMRGHETRLWGTWLDDAMLEGPVHPKLKLPTGELALFRAADLERALAGAELVVHAVSSEGCLPVLTKAAAFLPDVPVLSVTKGFLESPRTKKMDRIDLVAEEVLGRKLRFVHAGGPAKAMEIARKVLTLMCFAGSEADARACQSALGGGHLRVATSTDLAGAELSSALKNAYATGLGLWDGFVGKDAHNARAACFTQAIHEMRRMVVASGGKAETVNGAAGVGDLHVTAAAGRNRAFGELIGKGRPASEVAAEMAAKGELTEGYPAIATAWRFAGERGIGELPLLEALYQVVWEGATVESALGRLELTAS